MTISYPVRKGKSFNRLSENYKYNTNDSLDSSVNISSLNLNRIYETAINKLRILKSVSNSNSDEIKYKRAIIAKHKIEWHRKISLAFACLMMFFVGASIGSIVRKGGFSIPLLISIILFVVYYVISISGEKTAKDLSVSPLEGMWIANFIFIPISILLFYLAINNSKFPKLSDYFKINI